MPSLVPILVIVHAAAPASRALRVATRAATPPLDTTTTTRCGVRTREPGRCGPNPSPGRLKIEPHVYLPGTTSNGGRQPGPPGHVPAAQRHRPALPRTVRNNDLGISRSQVRVLPGAHLPQVSASSPRPSQDQPHVYPTLWFGRNAPRAAALVPRDLRDM